LLLDEIENSGQDLRTSALEMARLAIELEHEHILTATKDLADRTGESLEKQIKERTDILDTFFDAYVENDDETPRRAQEILDEISGLAHLPVRLTSEQMRTLTEDPRQLQEPIQDQVENFLTGITITRFLGAIENRLGDPLDLDRSSLQGQDWDEIVYQVMLAVQADLEKRKENLVGENGQVVRDLEAILQRAETNDDSGRIRLLNTIAQGRKTAFDNKTHRQVQQVTVRFSYIYLAAKLLEDIDPDEVMDAVIEHLEQARDVIRRTWGQTEWVRLTQNLNIPRLVDLPQIAAVVTKPDGTDLSEDRINLPLPELDEDERQAVVFELGKRTQTQIYRQVLLGAITELWVDYLTKVESLRISIGLEAYAQRDPLVQYKGQASHLFQSLLGDIRSAVISRIFLYTPRIQSSSQPEINSELSDESQVADVPRKKKRRRH
jgi:preprotein translocase subunit SecA